MPQEEQQERQKPKMRLNKIFAIILIGMFSFSPAFAEEGEVKLLPPIQTEEEQLDNSVDEALQNVAVEEVITPKVEDIKEMTPNSNDDIRKEVVADTNNHLKGVIKKFLAAMAGVVVSSLLIFLLATLFNKFKRFQTGKPEEFFEEPEKEAEKEKEEPPLVNDENEALKIFFDKTK